MTAFPDLVVVGTGAVGRGLTFAHAAAGAQVTVVSRSADRAQAVASAAGPTVRTARLCDVADRPLVVLAVADRAIAEVARSLTSARRVGGPPSLYLHTSGALPGSVLGLVGGSGSLHPLQSFPTTASPDALRACMLGTHWFFEGDGGGIARGLVAAWGGVFHALAPGTKALYHAGAATLSNYTVALYADATRLFAAAGVPADESTAALSSLLGGTATNLAALGPAQALTGPVARGDVATVAEHVRAMQAAAPDLLPAYIAMARRTAVLAQERGTLDGAAAAALEALFTASLPA